MSQKSKYAIIFIALITAMLVLKAAISATAPTALSPFISGYLIADGKVLANVTVVQTISSKGVEIVHNTTTDAQGLFEFSPTLHSVDLDLSALDSVEQNITVLYQEQARTILSMTSTHGLHPSLINAGFLSSIKCNINADHKDKPYVFSSSRYDAPVLLQSLCDLNT